MSEPTHVWMYNPDTEGTWACPVGYLEIAKLRGWVETDDPDPELDALRAAAPQPTPVVDVPQTSFDPRDHTVAEVNEYLAQVPESAPGEVERVLELERVGADRKTVKDPRTDVDTPSDVPGD